MDKSDPSIEATGSRRGPGAPAAGSGAEAYARWLEHMQRSRTRHAAITRNLYSWSSYKNWAEKMRTAWVEDEDK
jgi:hypothetical protein